MVDLKNSVARSGMDTPNKNGYFSSQSVQKLNGQNKPLVWLFISLILFVCLVGMFGITSLGGFLLSQNKTEPLNMSQTAQETQIPTFTNSDLSSIRTKTPTLQATHTNVSTLTDAPTQGQITQQLEQCNSNLPDTTCYHSYRVLSGQLLIVFFVKSLEQDNIPYAVLGGHKLKCILSTQFTDGFISCSSMNVVPAGKWDVSLFTKEDELISTGFISLASAGSTFTPTKKTSSNDSIYPTDLPTTETPPTDITETPPTDTPPTVPPTVPPTSPPTNPPPTNPPTSPPPTNPPPTATPKP